MAKKTTKKSVEKPSQAHKPATKGTKATDKPDPKKEAPKRAAIQTPLNTPQPDEPTVPAGANAPTLPQSAPVWKPKTAYALTDTVQPVPDNGHAYACTVAGTSGTSQPSFPVKD